MTKIKVVDTREQTGFLRLTVSPAVICLQLQDIRDGRGCSRWIFAKFMCTPRLFFFVSSLLLWDWETVACCWCRIFISTRHKKTRTVRKTGEHLPRCQMNLCHAWAINIVRMNKRAAHVYLAWTPSSAVPISCRFLLTILARDKSFPLVRVYFSVMHQEFKSYAYFSYAVQNNTFPMLKIQ